MPKTISGLSTSIPVVVVETQKPDGTGEVLQADANGSLLVYAIGAALETGNLGTMAAQTQNNQQIVDALFQIVARLDAINLTLGNMAGNYVEPMDAVQMVQ